MTLATASCVLDTRTKYNTYIKIRITFQRRSRYFPSSYDNSLTQQEFANKKLKKTKDAEAATAGDILTANRIIRELGANFTFEKFEKRYNTYLYGKEMNPKTFSEATEAYMKDSGLSFQTVTLYRTVAKKVETYSPGVLLEEMDSDYVKGLCNDIKIAFQLINRKPISENSLRIYLRCCSAVYNHAMQNFDIPGPNPFSKIKGQSLSCIRREKAALSEEELRTIFSYRTDNPIEILAKDFFCLTFAMQGANLVDILSLRNCDIQDGYFTFIRTKTQRTGIKITGQLSEQAAAILNKYGAIRPECPQEHVLPYLRPGMSGKQIRFATSGLNKKINKGLHQISKATGLRYFTLYFARHSFATFLRDQDFSILQIQQFLGHSSSRTTQSYIGSLSQNTKQKERSLIDNFLEGCGAPQQ